MKKESLIFVLISFAFLISGCSHTVRTSILRPPKVKIPGSEIAVGRIEGSGGDDLQKKIGEELSRYGYYAVYDGKLLEKILIREGMTWTNYVLPDNLAKIGKAIGGEPVIIFGEVLESRYDERPVRYENVEERDSKGRIKVYQKVIREWRAIFSAELKIVNLLNGATIFADSFGEVEVAATEAKNSMPPPIDGLALLAKCRSKVAEEFSSLLMPYRSILELKFKINSEIPELEEGYEYALADEWEKAIECFEKAITEHSNSWEAFWDLGLAYEATGQYEKADQSLTKAFELRPKKFIAAEIRRNRRLWKEAR